MSGKICGLERGRVRCWQIGGADEPIPASLPLDPKLPLDNDGYLRLPEPDAKVVDIAGGIFELCVATDQGRSFCWTNGYYSTGTPTTFDYELEVRDLVDLEWNDYAGCGLDGEGMLHCWLSVGATDWCEVHPQTCGEAAPPPGSAKVQLTEPVIDFVVASHFACVLDRSGQLHCRLDLLPGRSHRALQRLARSATTSARSRAALSPS